MGEVVEINIVSCKKCPISDLLQFVLLQMGEKVVKKTIEIMDNWQYENVFEITNEEEIEQFIDNKIICITEIRSIGQAGINIEVLNNCYIYCIWFNSKKYFSDSEYIILINNFIEYIFSGKIFENISICAIGKEVRFEYLADRKKIISTAHNIDVWILDNEEYFDNNFKDYEILEDKNCGTSKFKIYVATQFSKNWKEKNLLGHS